MSTLRTLSVMTVALVAASCAGEADTAEATADPIDAAEVGAMVDQTAYGFDDLDMDGDSELDADEVHEWLEGPVLAYYMPRARMVDRAEPDQTGALDTSVTIDGLFAAWDVNDDEKLQENEWERAAEVLETFSDTEVAWIEWDADGSQAVDLLEVHTRVGEDKVLAAVDADQDGQISESEMKEWFFDLFDRNGNGAIDQDEWRMAELYFDIPTL